MWVSLNSSGDSRRPSYHHGVRRRRRRHQLAVLDVNRRRMTPSPPPLQAACTRSRAGNRCLPTKARTRWDMSSCMVSLCCCCPSSGGTRVSVSARQHGTTLLRLVLSVHRSTRLPILSASNGHACGTSFTTASPRPRQRAPRRATRQASSPWPTAPCSRMGRGWVQLGQ